MNYFLTDIKVNKIFHLEDFNIHIDDTEKKHLIITGKNGSGKTILLNAIIEYLERIREDQRLKFLNYRKYLLNCQDELTNLNTNKEQEIFNAKQNVSLYQKLIEDAFGKVELSFSHIYQLSEAFHENNFIIAFYEAERHTKMVEPRHPMKADMSPVSNLKQKKADQFLIFLANYKIQEALARNENQMEDAELIHRWFIDFTNLLREIFESKDLELEFNYKNYSFQIISNEKVFKFTELSAGYSAVLDIVTDLILKMQSQDSLPRAYEKQGVVLIDEIETHLHLELQQIILPLLTRVFPNIQFIVTTHSPFVLNSLPNAVAFDLESKEAIEDLTGYSYEALAEGYFGVRTESSNIQIRLERLRELASLSERSQSEQIELNELLADFEKMSEAAIPNIKAAYYEIVRTLKPGL